MTPAVLLFVTSLLAASPDAPVDRAALEAAQAAGEWATVAAGFEQLVTADATDAQAWMGLARALRNLGRLEEAATAYRTAIARGAPPSFAQTGLAITLATAGDTTGALAALEAAVAAGLPPAALINTPGLEPLRTDPRFTALLERANRAAFPCEHDPRWHELDFWVGAWTVWSGGTQVGTNRIERDQRGCVLIENWTGATGQRGMSINYRDPSTGKWRQNWVAESGWIVWYEGAVQDGVLRSEGESISADGSKTLGRIELSRSEDRTLHHVIERSSDGGVSWTRTFDAVYRPTAAD